MTETASDRGVRARMREAITRELSEAAVQAFSASGFDGATVDEIVARVGVSKRTFFRYFASKEDAVLQPLEELGHDIADRLAARPPEEPPLEALRRSLDVIVDDYAASEDRWRTVMQLNLESPALRARHLAKMDQWLDELAPVLASRMNVPLDDLRPRLYGSVALAALEAAIRRWFSVPGQDTLAGAIDLAMDSLGSLVCP